MNTYFQIVFILPTTIVATSLKTKNVSKDIMKNWL
jgi:hypothetical protein